MEDTGIHEAVERGHLNFMDGKHHVDLQVARSPSDLLMLNRGVSQRAARVGGIIMALIVALCVFATGWCFVIEIQI